MIDDWGTTALTDEQPHHLFEILDDRYDRRSTLIAAQLPIKHWHDIIGDPTLADAILDRLIHPPEADSQDQSERRIDEKKTKRLNYH